MADFRLTLTSGFLAKFDQDAAGALGMKEGDGVSMGTATRRFVDEADALRFEAGELGAYVVDAIGHVMQFARCIAAKLLDRRISGKWLEQFDHGVAGRNADDFDALFFDGFMVEAFESERLSVDFFDRLEVTDDDTYMIDGISRQTRVSLAQSTRFCASCARRQARVPLAQTATSPAA